MAQQIATDMKYLESDPDAAMRKRYLIIRVMERLL